MTEKPVEVVAPTGSPRRFVVEVVAQMGDSIVDVRHVGIGGEYRIGSGPGVDLPATVATTFPLVTSTDHGFVVRPLVGIPAIACTTDGQRPLLGEHALGLGEEVVLVLGKVVVTIALVDAATTGLPRSKADRRPIPFVAASLVAHLAAWGLIISLVAPRADFAKVRAPETARKPVPFKTQVLEPEKPDAKRAAHAKATAPLAIEAVAAAAPAATIEDRRARAVASARNADIGGADMGAMVGAVMGSVDLAAAMADLGPIMGEDEISAHEFGGGRRYNPKIEPAKIGAYSTVAHGRRAGEEYDLAGVRHTPAVSIAMCESSACTAGVAIKNEIRDRTWSLAACYKAAKIHNAVDVVLEFEVDVDGKATVYAAKGAKSLAPCVANVVSSIEFSNITDGVRVRYPLTFKPAA